MDARMGNARDALAAGSRGAGGGAAAKGSTLL